MLDIDIEKLARHDPCEFAKSRWAGLARWLTLWTILVFIFGATLLLAAIGTIILIFVAHATVGATIAGIGTVVNSAAVGFIVRERNRAAKAEKSSFDDSQQICASAAAEITAARNAVPRVLGFR